MKTNQSSVVAKLNALHAEAAAIKSAEIAAAAAEFEKLGDEPSAIIETARAEMWTKITATNAAFKAKLDEWWALACTGKLG